MPLRTIATSMGPLRTSECRSVGAASATTQTMAGLCAASMRARWAPAEAPAVQTLAEGADRRRES